MVFLPKTTASKQNFRKNLIKKICVLGQCLRMSTT